jgi:predicted transcriptional regulator of viral defense system
MGMFITDRILRLLAERPSMTRGAIRAALPDCKRVAVTGAISRLEDKGLIDAVGWGRYKLAAAVTISQAARARK